ncbi:hypothetical protein [Polyangium sp. y55x31]|uniref:hypothetical protein n=1 Tax=Polyangium sp. y55x31 TaxID=3042688 RepID=UPI0024826491|nr:hypothetical protein [Polyangium sp. y55x31]MDI1476740.1 hypothetical protein [Polyangium sp. y55x31]
MRPTSSSTFYGTVVSAVLLAAAGCGASPSGGANDVQVAAAAQPSKPAELPPAPAPQPPPESAPLPLENGQCPAPHTCRFELEGLTSRLLGRKADDVESVSLAGQVAKVEDAIPVPTEALLPMIDGHVAEVADDRFNVDVPLEVRFRDGSRAQGTLRLGGMTLRMRIEEVLRGAAKGPVALPADTPEAEKPRSMWVIGGTASPRLRGVAKTLQDVDWVLVADDVSRKAKCPDGSTVSIAALRARLYLRRSGIVIAERVFATSDSVGCRSEIGMRNAEPGARWAWDELRLRR